MASYICSRDCLFPLHPQLWLHVASILPTCSWFLRCLKEFCPADIADQSMRVGGATALAQANTSAELIWGAGRWSSDAFEHYIRKNVVVLHALILGHALHYSHATWFLFLLFFRLSSYALIVSVPVQVSHLLIFLHPHFSSKKKKKLNCLPLHCLSHYCTQINAKVCPAPFCRQTVYELTSCS